MGAVIISSGQTPETTLDEGVRITMTLCSLLCFIADLAALVWVVGAQDYEKEWYDRPWEWKQIAANAGWIVHLHSADDEVVPVSEGRRICQVRTRHAAVCWVLSAIHSI